jgi:hypothetical protein
LPTTGPYVDYVQLILQRVEAGRGAALLDGFGTDGTVLGSYPLLADAGRDTPVLGTEGIGSGETEVFEVPDSSRAYPFFFEFPAAAPVVMTAACDAGEADVLDARGPIPPTVGSMMITFPPESTRCSLRVETEPGAEWRLYSK